MTLKLVSKEQKAFITMIGSGKGGVGRTWLAITLANVLSETGKKVLLIDGDLAIPNIDLHLGILLRFDLWHVMQDKAPAAEAIKKTSWGFDLLGGRSGNAELATMSEVSFYGLIHQIQELATTYDHIIIDTSSGFNKLSKHFAGIVNKCLMILTCEPTSIIDAYAFIKAVKRNGLRFNTVVNQADSEEEAEKTYGVLENICKKFLQIDPGWIGMIPRDESVRDTVKKQSLLTLQNPDSEALLRVRELVGKLTILQ